ncbi:hypothetical protein Holit_02864 [Hollandina sp. SP2]
MKQAINGLIMALAIIPNIAVKDSEAKRWRDSAYKYVQGALNDIKALQDPRWETPEEEEC